MLAGIPKGPFMNRRINGKIAVLISGPIRYVTLVNRRLKTILKDCEYDCFYHLWSADLGNKIRAETPGDYAELKEHPRTKVLMVQSPYSEDSFAGTIGVETGSNSSINATMGMFFSVSLLCNTLQQLPDFEDYKYVLRLRTDCAILNDDFVSLLDLDPNVLTVSKSYFVRDEWISDHICFGSVDSFFRLWRYSGMNQIYEAYQAGERNPEVALLRRYQRNLAGVRLNPSIIRFRDYHIVYYPTRDCDPECINRAINEGGMEAFFLGGSDQIDMRQIDEFNARSKTRWNKSEAPRQVKKATSLVSVPPSASIKDGPRFSFVMIVLNGMPFIEYSLKSIYEFAHEVIIVEGAVEKCMFAANPDGSSTDETAKFIKSFPDPERKIKLIQGRWPEKCEMQNEALRHVTGDYVWLVDSDEVYKPEHLDEIKRILTNDPSITQVNFIPDNFWKGLDYIFVSPRFFEPAYHYRRLFKYVPGAVFISHRPPTMMWPDSQRTTEQMHLLDGNTTRETGIVPYHYSYVLDKQVRQKIELYHRYGWGSDWNIDLLEWYRECFLKWTPENRHVTEQRYPVWTGDKNSRTQLFTGAHPEVVEDFRSTSALNEIWPEGQILRVIGDPYYQNKVVQAWSHIEIDASVQKRKDLMVRNIEGDDSFWNIHVALAFLADRLQPRSYLEIGVRTGCSLVSVLNNSEVREVVAIDTWEGSYAGRPNTREYAVKQVNNYQTQTNRNFRIDLIKGDSHEKLKELIRSGRKFDLITVDGDHTENGAWEDLEDAAGLLSDTGAIVFDDIVHPSHSYLRKLVDRFQQRYPDYAVLINDKQDNGCAVFLKGIDVDRLLTARDLSVSETRNKQVRVAADYVQTGTSVEAESSFGTEIRKLFAEIRPRKIIETGTYLGTGTTAIIVSALETLGIHDAIFYTIEVNPQNYTSARAFFAANNMNVRALNGLSVPRSMLPDPDEIARRTITDVDYDGIFVDHNQENRVQFYYDETDFPLVEDDLLYKCLERFDFRPDFVLLDSAGHMGSIEFDYLIDHLQAECYIALDDIYHVKHHCSFQRIQSDPRFEVFTASKEKFGFCIARFMPARNVCEQSVKHFLWVRTDSIGDAVLASSMLAFVRERYGHPKITVVCRSHIAELYENCPYVDAVVTFDEKQLLNNSAYASEIFESVRNLRVDCTLNSVYSRDVICDLMVGASGAGLRIGMHGNLCNISEELRAQHDQWYTHLLSSAGERKSELERHVDFLHGIGCEVDELTPKIWLTVEDEAFADDWFERHGFHPQQTVALFAGVQSPERIYTHSGKAIAEICRENGFSVVALGAGNDRELNRHNLKDIENAGVRACDSSGKLTLRQSAAIIKRCHLAVGAETGLAHIAAAVGTEHVIVIGGGQFGRFMPYSPLTSLVCLPLVCYGCGWKCAYRESQVYCVASIPPDVIEYAVRETLRTPSSKPRLFVQDRSLWDPQQGTPQWEPFDRMLNVENVEIIPVSWPTKNNTSTEQTTSSVDVSIIVATKNRAHLLDDMLTSVKEAATGVACEVIAIEGGSSDHTRQILEKHGITQVYDESECLGPGEHSWAQLYNFGFSKARGRWAMYASDDIVFEKGCIAKAVDILRDQKSPSVAGGVFFYREIIPEYPGWEKQGICFALGHKLLMNFGLIQLDVFKKLGGFDETYLFRGADIDLSFKIYKNGQQLIPLSGCLLIHNNVQDELKKKGLQTAQRDHQCLLRKWKDFVPPRLDPPKRLFWEPQYATAFTMPSELEDVNVGTEHFWHGLACLQIGQHHEAVKWFSQALNISCKHWTVFWLVAEALYHIGYNEQARKTADFVLRINPGCVEIQPLLNRLKSRIQPIVGTDRNAGSGPVIHVPRSHFVIEVKYGGIGDHLFYSHLPRIAKQSGQYDRVYISNHSKFRSPEYRELVWERNPYVDGFCDENADYPVFDSVEEGTNILDKIMLLRGLDDGKRFHEPELYLKYQRRTDLCDAVVYDPNFVSYVGDVSREEIESFLRHNHIHVTHQMRLWEKHYALDHCDTILRTDTLEDFCQVIVSCRQLLCLSSGTATLAAALGKPAIVFCGNGQKKMFHHSHLHRYVNCSAKISSAKRIENVLQV
jgi:ADP-heptose:LPS heptosyltransferase/glycosyltransferase involved in cell wall biosynthesis/predicted O-methyltransferase YrrM